MKVPEYVRTILSRSAYCYDWPKSRSVDCGPGYTIRVRKATPYTQARTFCDEITRFRSWVMRQYGGEAQIISVPSETHHRYQYAVITIWDPVMRHLEEFLPENQVDPDLGQ